MILRSIELCSFILVVLAQGFAEAGSLSPQKNTQSKDVGRIVGRVQVEGHFEKPGPLPVYKNRDFCGPQVPNQSLLVDSHGGLKNVVVMIAGARSETREKQLKNLVLDNRNCAFVPHVQIAPVGSEILLLNSDPILH